MKRRFLIPLFAAAALVGCDSSGPEEAQAPAPEDPAAPAAAAQPDAETLAAIGSQAIGKRLLGKTSRLSGDAFVPADPAFVPEAYFIYYSASW